VPLFELNFIAFADAELVAFGFHWAKTAVLKGSIPSPDVFFNTAFATAFASVTPGGV
jgi:hypothetical protein